jgi:hypothetical protein
MAASKDASAEDIAAAAPATRAPRTLGTLGDLLKKKT